MIGSDWLNHYFSQLIDVQNFCFAEIYCPPLEAPFRGFITPTDCTDDRANIKRNTVCNYGCVAGHYLAGGAQYLVCQLDGMWKGNVPYCKRKCLKRVACIQK